MKKAPKKPTCSYGGTPGAWNCRVGGCAAVKLDGIQVQETSTYACAGVSALSAEFQRFRALCMTDPDGCDDDRCIAKYIAVLDLERDACACVQPKRTGFVSDETCSSRAADADADPRIAVVQAADAAGDPRPGDISRSLTSQKPSRYVRL